MLPEWKYIKGNPRHFIKAPEWVTVRTRISKNGKVIGDAWLEKHSIGSRALSIGHRKDGEYTVGNMPYYPVIEEIIAIREKYHP
ncbi:hypothetical protein LU604_15585 [Erwinia tracheiphila]|nr:hypothetical protein [Erwinia tracheiphila]UIA82058.1 hypothetical protein LU604_15585 [Erwinia tracheiphila]